MNCDSSYENRGALAEFRPMQVVGAYKGYRVDQPLSRSSSLSLDAKQGIMSWVGR